MRRLLSVGVLTFLLLLFTHSSFGQSDPFDVTTISQTTAEYKVVAIDRAWVNVRTGPGTNHSILDCLPHGSEGKKIREKEGWYEIKFSDELTGFVRKDLVADITPAQVQPPAPPANLAAQNREQFERWNRHLGECLLDYSKFSWFWRLGRARRAFARGNYQTAYNLASRARGNPIEAAYMQAMALNEMGQPERAAEILSALEQTLEDKIIVNKLKKISQPYKDEPIVFKFGGFDDIDTYREKKAQGNRVGLNSSEYYERFVDINTWQWRSDSAYREFQSIGGIDCSGFVQLIQQEAYKQTDVSFPIRGRTSTSGLWSGKYADEINPGFAPPPPPDIRPGDMILLQYEHNRFGHSMIYKGLDAQGNIRVLQMGQTPEVTTLSPDRYQYYKGTYRMKGMDEVRNVITA